MSMRSQFGAGALAGLAGTGAMLAMRTFDEKYAKETMPAMNADPGAAFVERAERLTRTKAMAPHAVTQAAAMSTHFGYGALAGALYALFRPRSRNALPLIEGAGVGLIVFALGYLVWLPTLGFTRPLWKQRFPAIVGESLRHVVYGVTTAVVLRLFRRR